MFLSSSIVVVVMLLLPMIPSFEVKKRKELLNELLKELLGSNHLGRVFSVLESRSFSVSFEVAKTVW